MSEQLDFYFSQKQKQNDTAIAKRAGRSYILTYFRGQEYTECVGSGKIPYCAHNYGDAILVGTGTSADVTRLNPESEKASRDAQILYWAKQLEGKTLSLHELVKNAKWLIANVK